MADLILSTADESIIDTPLDTNTYLLVETDGQIVIGARSFGRSDDDPSGAVPLYSTSGVPIFSTSGVPVYEGIIIEPDDLDNYQVIGECQIIIDWSASSRKDLDCCAYWADNSGYFIGWSYEPHGGLADDNYTAWWTGDDTGDGPEKIALLTSSSRRSSKESSPYQYKVHLNFYAEGSGTSTATVTVTKGDVTLSKTISPSTNQGQAATISDPSVTITFDYSGKPISIT